MGKLNKEKESEIKFKKIYDFFCKHYSKKIPFTRKQLQEFAGYENPDTLETYFSKRIQDLVISDPSDTSLYYIRDNFKLYSRYEAFRNLISQRARLIANYRRVTYDKVLIYEFYMPMANERVLKSCLDNLFYTDTIKFRLKTIPRKEIEKFFPKNDLNNDEYISSICNWIAKKFFGYSIEIVSGRFRAENIIMTYAKAGELLSSGRDYLIDETTAIVRFIFPLEPGLNDSGEKKIDNFIKEKIRDEKRKVWFIFERLFIESIHEVVNGEDQIWMIERSLNKTKLHVWKVESKNF